MNQKLTVLVLGLTIAGSAFASCPQIEGKYRYTCTVTKDDRADFASVLEVSGAMVVEQKGCDSYTFINPDRGETEDFRLLDVVDSEGRSQAKIRRSDSSVIRFKTIAHSETDLGMDSLSSWVTKGTIKKKRDGFSLKGKERSRILGIFGKRHSKFACRFTNES